MDATKITTAVSELARNILVYAAVGKIGLETLNQKTGIKISAVDHGPGIENIQQTLEDHYTTSGSLGAGLPGVKRLMDEFTIDSVVGEGTTVCTTKWLRATNPNPIYRENVSTKERN
ncbi:serine/threonine-protein kinase RsbT [Geomicrobium halophilum]|uniref:Serine/threonine-protein kinase RsbT n=1 Tax=Geomicrobium halophilum TaxID=549000 RepID=A0A841Q0I5_9BACL|nr:serine/threonine-protein kinase RsbT [Geomicrobium halophilum]